MPQLKRLHHEVERSSAYFIAGFRTLYLFCLLPLSTTYELCPRNATAQSDNLTPHLRVWTHALEIQVKWTVTNHSLIGEWGLIAWCRQTCWFAKYVKSTRATKNPEFLGVGYPIR